MKGPLDGIRVLDWSIAVNGGLASCLLGDLGAEVIKIERPVTGDYLRVAGAMVAAQAGLDCSQVRKGAFESINRNKKGIAVDLTKEAGREILYRLVEKADAFLHNYRLSVVRRLKLDYESLSQYNPKLIYANATAFGTEGPDRDLPGYDYVVCARSGLMDGIGEPDLPPMYYAEGTAVGDHTAAFLTAHGIVAALYARERLGIGQEVNTSVLGALLGLQRMRLGLALATGHTYQRVKRSKATNPLNNHYQCSDGKWLVLALHQADRYWHDFCEVMGIHDLENDPRFENYQTRAKNGEEFVAILDRIFASQPRDEWLRRLREKEDFVVGPLNTLQEEIEDPQVVANEQIVDFDDPRYGKIKTVGFPFQLSKTRLTVRTGAPELGQHTEEVLIELLGYSWDDIVRLRDDEVI